MIKNLLTVFMILIAMKSQCEDEYMKDLVRKQDTSIDDYLRNTLDCNWFSAKNFYYKAQKDQDLELVNLTLDFLKKYSAFRLAIIDKFLYKMINKENDFVVNGLQEKTKDDLFFKKLTLFNFLKVDKENGNDFYSIIEKYIKIEDTMTFIEIKTETGFKFYILNAFGSVTPTSDYDFDITIIPLKVGEEDIKTDYVEQLEFIIEVTKLKSDLEKKFEEIYKNKGMDKSFDANIYPNTAIFEDFYQTIGIDEIQEKKPGKLIRENYITTSVYQLCVVPYINLIKSGFVSMEKFKEFSEICTKNIIISQSKILKEYYKNHDKTILGNFYNNELINSVFFKESNLITDLSQFKDEDIKKIIDEFTLFTKIYTEDYKKEEKQKKFEECLLKTRDPKKYFDQLKKENGDDSMKKNLLKEGKDKNVTISFYEELFIMADETIETLVRRDPIPNRVYLPFIGSCLIFAEEAYVTFGALKFVKNEKKILSGDYKLNCQNFLENYLENFGMLFMHLKEEALHNGDIRDKNISDAVSKYFRRALAITQYDCYPIKIIVPQTEKILLYLDYRKNKNGVAFNNFFMIIHEIYYSDSNDKKSDFYKQYLILLDKLEVGDFKTFTDKLNGFFYDITSDLIQKFKYDFVFNDIAKIVESENFRII